MRINWEDHPKETQKENQKRFKKGAPLLPPGQYVCQIRGVYINKTVKGDEYWTISFRLDETLDDDLWKCRDVWKNRWVNKNFYFSEKGMKFTRYLLEALGFPTEGILDINPQQLEGLWLTMKIRNDKEADGKIHSRPDPTSYRKYESEIKPKTPF